MTTRKERAASLSDKMYHLLMSDSDSLAELCQILALWLVGITGHGTLRKKLHEIEKEKKQDD